MPAFQFTDEQIANANYYRANELEDKILNDEQDTDLRRLYMYILSKMNRKTGIAGKESHISRYALNELFNPKGNRGQKKQKKGWEYIRWRLTKLEELGLIIKKGELVFELPIATQDKHVQMRYTQSTHANHTPFNNAETPINTEALEIMNDEVHTGDFSKYTPPHKSYIKENIISTSVDIIQKKSSKRACKLTDEFKVSEKHIEVATENNWPNPHDEIEAFRDFHISKGNTYVDWDRAFYTWLRNSKRWNKGEGHAAHKRNAPKSEGYAEREYKTNNPPRFDD